MNASPPSKLKDLSSLNQQHSKHYSQYSNHSGQSNIQQNKLEDEESPPKKNKLYQKSNSLNIMGQFISNQLGIKNKKYSLSGFQKMEDLSFQEGKGQIEGFAQMYKDNLRKTVFNETKMMLKEKKKIQYRIQSIDPPGTYRGGSSMLMYSQPKKVNKTISEEKNTTTKDTMYKTIIQIPSVQREKVMQNNELGISKFPIIKRKKKMASLQNVQRLFQAFNIDKQMEKQAFPKRGKRKNKELFVDRSPWKQQINPWQTFADQFD